MIIQSSYQSYGSIYVGMQVVVGGGGGGHTSTSLHTISSYETQCISHLYVIGKKSIDSL